MALNPKKIQFLFKQLSSSDNDTYSNTTAQLFNYLDNEVKDNSIFDSYESNRVKWSGWPDEIESSFNNDWQLPKSIDEAKSLAYSLYRLIAENDSDWFINYTFNLFQESHLADNTYKFNRTFLGYFGEALDDITLANPEMDDKPTLRINGSTVFIIHGHDKGLKQEVQLLLEKADLDSIVLHEQPDRGRTIIEKLIDETDKAGYAIALLTPDDVVDISTNRARQNVILEIGYFLGKLGKSRIRMLVKGNVDIPSDLHGILYEKYDNEGVWKIKILREMQAIGFEIEPTRLLNIL